MAPQCFDFNDSRIVQYNDSTPSHVLQPSLTLVKSISYIYISPMIICAGVFGDLMSIIVLSHPFLRKTSVVYIYLLILAITDLMAHLSVIPMLLWILDYRLCTASAAFYYAYVGFPLANAFMGASVWVVVFITLGQYVAVCHPFVQTFRSKRICICLSVLAYALGFLIYIPWIWRKQVRHVVDVGPEGGCPYVVCDNLSVINASWYHAYQLMRESISRFVPFLLIVYFNTRILFVYRRSKNHRLRVVGGEHQKLNVKEKTERQEKRLWYLLLAIMSIFFVCTLPAAVLTMMVSDKWERHLTFQIIRSISNILEFTKFALNFYLYCMINPDIRRLFVRRVLCRQRRRQSSMPSEDSPKRRPALLKGTRNALSALLSDDDHRRRKSSTGEFSLHSRKDEVALRNSWSNGVDSMTEIRCNKFRLRSTPKNVSFKTEDNLNDLLL